MLQNPRKTLGLIKNIVHKIPPGGGKPYPASCLIFLQLNCSVMNCLNLLYLVSVMCFMHIRKLDLQYF